ncbi:hypothetical protein EMCRGX_G003620 [Ephydatia muelleri]
MYWGKCEGKKTALISPHTFSGNSSWSDWVDHFEAVAKVNQWDEDTKLIWLPVKLKRKAQTAWKRLSEETREDCRLAMDAFQKRFEPSSKPERYATEFRLRKRKSGHDLALQLMVDTGAAVSLLRREQWSRLSGAEKHKMEQWDGGRLVGVACRSGRCGDNGHSYWRSKRKG